MSEAEAWEIWNRYKGEFDTLTGNVLRIFRLAEQTIWEEICEIEKGATP